MKPVDPSEATLFEAALERATPEARADYLDQACAGQPALRRRVEGLLAAHDQSDKFLERPAAKNQPTIKLDLAPEETPGTMIGRYKLLQKIGEGGMGVVYMAEQTEPVVRRVALKIIKLGMDTRQVVARFEAERQALALMDHPNIAKVLDAGATVAPVAADILTAVEPGFQPGGKGAGSSGSIEHSEAAGRAGAYPGGKMPPSTAGETPAAALSAGRPYFVMELVHGVPITEYCDKNKLSTTQRLELFIPVCQAIQHAHQKGIIHRDIKPSNVMVTLHDGVPVPKVIDFGVAKATNQRLTEKTLFTHYAQMIGTPAYMSPEQAEMSGLDIDTRSDVYSLGVLLYELLTGSTPFDAKELLSKGYAEMQRIIAEQEPVKPSTRMSTLQDEQRTVVAKNRNVEESVLRRDLQGDLDWIVMKCLEKDRTRRYETSNGLAADLRRHLSNELITARPPTTGYLLKKLIKRHKLAFAAGTAIAAALVVGFGIATWQYYREKAARQRAIVAEQKQQSLREQAEIERTKAEMEVARSQQVTRFLKSMVEGAGPNYALGRDATMLREILDKTAERVGKELADQPEVRAELLNTIGTTYHAVGESRKSETAHREALKLRRKAYGETNTLVAESMFNLAITLTDLKAFPESERLHREALAMRRQLLDSEHRDVTGSLYGLADLLSDAGKQMEAEAVIREALALRRKLFGNENAEVAETLALLGVILSRSGRAAEAEPVLREALALQSTLFGSNHLRLATYSQWLSSTLRNQGKLQEAESLQLRALSMRRQLLGEQHSYTASSLRALGDLRVMQGKPAEAESAFRESLAIFRTRGDEAAIDGSLEALVGVLLSQGRPFEARALFREAAGRGEVGGMNLAAWHLATSVDPNIRDGSAAVVWAEEAAGKTIRKNAYILNTLAAAYAEVGQFDKAVAVQQEAITLLTDDAAKQDFTSRLKLYESRSPYRDVVYHAWMLAASARSLIEQQRFVEAEAPARECFAIREKHIPDAWVTFNARSLLGGSLLGQKKYAKAEPLLVSAYEGMKQREAKIPQAGQPRLKETLQRLVQLYEAINRPDSAAEWKQKLMQIEEIASGTTSLGQP